MGEWSSRSLDQPVVALSCRNKEPQIDDHTMPQHAARDRKPKPSLFRTGLQLW